MVVGILRIRLYVRQSRSLKEKRHALRKIKDKLTHLFNVSVAEVDGLDDWKNSTIGVTTTGNDYVFIRSCLDQVRSRVEGLHVAEILGTDLIVSPVNDEDFHQATFRPQGEP